MLVSKKPSYGESLKNTFIRTCWLLSLQRVSLIYFTYQEGPLYHRDAGLKEDDLMKNYSKLSQFRLAISTILYLFLYGPWPMKRERSDIEYSRYAGKDGFHGRVLPWLRGKLIAKARGRVDVGERRFHGSERRGMLSGYTSFSH